MYFGQEGKKFLHLCLGKESEEKGPSASSGVESSTFTERLYLLQILWKSPLLYQDSVFLGWGRLLADGPCLFN